MTESKLEQAATEVVRAAFYSDHHPISALMGMNLETQKLRLAICALADVLRDDDDDEPSPPAESPEDWVTQDLPPLPDVAEPINPNADWVDITNRKDHVLRKSIDWFFVLDGKGWEVVDGYDGTTIDQFGVDDGSLIRCLRRDLPENLETPQRTRVRMWVHQSMGTVICSDHAPHGYEEIHCDADGFYVD